MASLRSVDRNLKFSLVQSVIGHPLPPYVILVDSELSPPSGRAARRPPEIDRRDGAMLVAGWNLDALLLLDALPRWSQRFSVSLWSP